MLIKNCVYRQNDDDDGCTESAILIESGITVITIGLNVASNHSELSSPCYNYMYNDDDSVTMAVDIEQLLCRGM